MRDCILQAQEYELLSERARKQLLEALRVSCEASQVSSQYMSMFSLHDFSKVCAGPNAWL